MGFFDTIAVKHSCPSCNGKLNDYQTKSLGQQMEVYKLGDEIPSKVEDMWGGEIAFKPNFEFPLYDHCGKCDIHIEGVGIVKRRKIVQIKETGYREFSEARKKAQKMRERGVKDIMAYERLEIPFVSLERVIAALS